MDVRVHIVVDRPPVEVTQEQREWLLVQQTHLQGHMRLRYNKQNMVRGAVRAKPFAPHTAGDMSL